MTTYEAVFILDERKFDDGGEAFLNDLVKQVEGLGGTVKQRTLVGRRQFSRPIRKQTSGIYLSLVFDLGPDKVAPLKENYRLNDAVFRSEVFIYVEPPPRRRVRDDDRRDDDRRDDRRDDDRR